MGIDVWRARSVTVDSAEVTSPSSDNSTARASAPQPPVSRQRPPPQQRPTAASPANKRIEKTASDRSGVAFACRVLRIGQLLLLAEPTTERSIDGFVVDLHRTLFPTAPTARAETLPAFRWPPSARSDLATPSALGSAWQALITRLHRERPFELVLAFGLESPADFAPQTVFERLRMAAEASHPPYIAMTSLDEHMADGVAKQRLWQCLREFVAK